MSGHQLSPCGRLLAGLLLGAILPAVEPAIAITSDQPGNVFEGASGSLTVTAAAAGRAEIEDETGAVTTRPLAAGTPLVLALPGPGWYQVRAEAGAERAATAALVLGRSGPLPGRDRATGGFFAVETLNPLAARAGGRWNRVFLDLTQVHAEGDGFRWHGPSAKDMSWLTGLGIDLPKDQEWIVCLRRIPDAWTTKPAQVPEKERWKTYPPRDWDRLAALMRWAIAGLPPEVRHLEVINEPDADWRGGEPALARFHNVVAEAAHAVRPDMRVLGPCLYAVKVDQLMRLDRLGLFNNLDGLSIHPYVNGTAPEGEFIERIDAMLTWNAARQRPLPVYFTEFGWQTNPKDWQLAVDERTKARYTARAQLLLAARPEITAYQLFCLLHRKGADWDAYSMLAADGSPRLAYAYAATVMHRLAGATRMRVLRLGPEAYALMWASDGSTGLALWSGKDPVSLRLPAPATAAWSAAGRILAPPTAAAAEAGPDPFYLSMEGTGLARAASLPPLTVPVGATAPLPFTSLLAASAVVEPVPAPGRGWRVRADAPRGTWQLAGRTADGWAVLPLTVAPPVEAAGTLVWQEGAPSWRVALTSHLGVPATVGLDLALGGGGARTATVQVAAGGRASVDLPLAGQPWGRQLAGTLTTTVAGRTPAWRDPQPVKTTLAAISAAPPAGEPDWDRLPAMDITAWAPFRGFNQAVTAPRQGLSARLRLAHGATGILLDAEVDDPEHLQTQPPDNMWRQDALVIAFDADADQPWEPNSGMFWNGHRVAEYGLALGPDGARCWRSVTGNGLAGDGLETRVMVEIVRTGGTTRYRATFPWSMLGLPTRLPAGRQLGVAVAVFDGGKDGNGTAPYDKFTGLRLFNGIVISKDPTAYGRFALLP
jgi:hypothetical protein